VARPGSPAAVAIPLALASLGSLLAESASAQRPAPDAPVLEEVAFEGNEVFPDDSLRLAIVNRGSGCRSDALLPFCWLGLAFAIDTRHLQPREVTRDTLRLRRYYADRGYREATVDTSSAMLGDDRIRLSFLIDEGRPIRIDSIAFVGDSILDPEVLRGLPVRVGNPFSLIALEAAQDSIVSRLRNSGYAHAEVLRNTFVPDETYAAEVTFDVFTGPLTRFGDIDIFWAGPDSSLSRETVLRFLPFREGDLYSREQILQAQRSLFAVELIQSAGIPDPRTTDTTDTGLAVPLDTILPVTVTITEGDVHRVRTGIGGSTSECLNGEARWVSRNFLGAARRLTVRGRVSNVFASDLNDTVCLQSGEDDFARLNWLASAELVQPWLFSTRNALTTSVFAERNSLPDVFIREAIGVDLSATRTLSAGLTATLSYSPQLSSLEAAEVFFCTSFLVCDPGDIDALQSTNWLAPLGLNATLDRTNSLLDPSEGFRLVLDLEHASSATASDFEYDRVIGEASYYASFARRTVAAFRLRAGWIRGGVFDGLEEPIEIIHPQKRFFSGGASSVRGFSQNRLGPRVLTTDVRNLLSVRPMSGGADEVICTPEQLVDLSCDPTPVTDGAFLPRPTGGARLVEANAEYRFRWGPEFQGVFFVDAGQVWSEQESRSLGDIEVTPGLGVRYFSPIGPIRVDVGFRFRDGERLQVITSHIEPFVEGSGDDRICVDPAVGMGMPGTGGCPPELAPIPWVRSDELAVLQERDLFGADPGFLGRMHLHVSIGQAF